MDTNDAGAQSLTLELLEGRYAVCRLDPGDAIPAWAGIVPAPDQADLNRSSAGTVPAAAWAAPPDRTTDGTGYLVSVTRTDAELSIVCAESAVPATVECAERGWRALRVAGPLDFNAIGVMARLTAPLAEAGISILALATFDTDYLLVRAPDLSRALAALRAAGHRVGKR